MMKGKKAYVGIVTEVVEMGLHGPYVVCAVEGLSYVTFSLNNKVWQETDRPERGTYIVLADLRKKPSGWRANSARYQQPEDIQEKGDQK